MRENTCENERSRLEYEQKKEERRHNFPQTFLSSGLLNVTFTAPPTTPSSIILLRGTFPPFLCSVFIAFSGLRVNAICSERNNSNKPA